MTKGKLKVKGDTISVSATFSKRTFVLTLEGEYPQDVEFQLSQAKCSLLDNIQVGQDVELEYNLRGREWTSPTGDVKYFNTLDVWQLKSVL